MTTRILLIDDDPTLLDLLSQYLRDAGFEVLSASDGPVGLKMAYGRHPDLALLDVMLPGMDGWEICARLREMTDIPIVMVTAKTSESDKLRGFRLGVDDYVTKPFSFAELVARIQAVLSRARSPDQDAGYAVYGNIRLDLKKYQAFSDDRILDLTPTEFRLLEALVRRRGHVATEKELMQEVWGGARQNDDSLVRRYILMLRKKIESDPANPARLLTVRGFGYRMGTAPLRPPDDDSDGGGTSRGR
jgi:two-component system KDP operon response regulator KdpE